MELKTISLHLVAKPRRASGFRDPPSWNKHLGPKVGPALMISYTMWAPMCFPSNNLSETFSSQERCSRGIPWKSSGCDFTLHCYGPGFTPGSAKLKCCKSNSVAKIKMIIIILKREILRLQKPPRRRITHLVPFVPRRPCESPRTSVHPLPRTSSAY